MHERKYVYGTVSTLLNDNIRLASTDTLRILTHTHTALLSISVGLEAFFSNCSNIGDSWLQSMWKIPCEIGENGYAKNTPASQPHTRSNLIRKKK